MTPKQEAALRQAREALHEFMTDYQSEDGMNSMKHYAKKHHAAITAIDEALAEQKAQVDPCIDGSCSCCWTHLDEQPAQQEPVALTGKQRIYLVQAWAMLDDYALDQRSKGNDSFADGAEASSHEIKMMLSAPQPAQQQEPVAWRVRMERTDAAKGERWWNEAAGIKMPSPDLHKQGDTILCWVNEGDYYAQMFTSPPASKPWVGLTEDERLELAVHENFGSVTDYACAIEAKLKEKNA